MRERVLNDRWFGWWLCLSLRVLYNMNHNNLIVNKVIIDRVVYPTILFRISNILFYSIFEIKIKSKINNLFNNFLYSYDFIITSNLFFTSTPFLPLSSINSLAQFNRLYTSTLLSWWRRRKGSLVYNSLHNQSHHFLNLYLHCL